MTLFVSVSCTLAKTICSDNNNLDISASNLVRADHPSNSKRVGVCICYKESLAV